MTKHIVVIGAGLSGLQTAEYILQQNKLKKDQENLKITVLEAQSRIGGRSYSEKLNGTWFDLGGMWIGPHQKYVIELAKRANEESFKQPFTGNKILEINGIPGIYKTDIPKNVNIFALLQMQYYIWKINSWAKQIPLDEPQKAKHAQYWDSMTVETWIQNHIYFQKVRKMFEMVIRAVFGVESCEISMLHFLQYTHQSGSLENLIEIKNGNQESKLVYGSQYLSKFLEKEILKYSQTQIVLNSPVTQIKFNVKIGQNQIKTLDDKTYLADYIVMAMPPGSLQHIQFSPPLSQEKDFISSRNIKGSIIKTMILYKNQFWKENGYSGEIVSDCVDSPVFNVFDDSRPNDDGVIQPALVVFTNSLISRQYRDLQTVEEFQLNILQKLQKLFNSNEAIKPILIHTQDWNKQEYIRGGPVSVFPPGVLSQLKNKIYQHEKNIHFAGTENATYSQGFLDGAIQSGIRCGEEILNSIYQENLEKKDQQQLDFYQFLDQKSNQYQLNNQKFNLLLMIIIFFIINQYVI